MTATRPRRRAPIPWQIFSAASCIDFGKGATGLSRLAGAGACAAVAFRHRDVRRGGPVLRTGAVWTKFLPDDRIRANQAACSGADRHQNRRDRSSRDRVEPAIRQLIPADALDNIVDNIGLPISGINIAYGNSGTIGVGDADLLITLKEGQEGNTREYMESLRERLPRLFPGASFAFLPADIVTQILNFGLPAPIDVRVIGNEAASESRIRREDFQTDHQCAGCRRPPYPASVQRADPQCRRGPLARARRGAEARTSQMRCRTPSPAACRPHRPSGSTPRTACPIPSSCRPRNTGWVALPA